MSTVATANVQLSSSGASDVMRDLGRVGSGLGTLATAAGTFVGQMGAQLFTSAISGLQTLGAEALQATASYEQMGMSLQSLAAREALASGAASSMAEALQQTSGRAAELLGWVQELAINSPFSAEGVAEAFRTAMAFGFTADEAQRLTQATIDFASATGASTAAMNQIALALGQIQAKGKVAGQEILQLVNAGLPALQILADAFGVTTGEMQKMIEKGLVPAEDAIEAITRAMEEGFGGAAERASESWAGLLGTFEDIKAMGLRALFEGLGDVIQPLAADFAIWLQGEGMDRLKSLGQDIGLVAQAAVGLGQVFGGLIGGTDMWIVGIGKLMEQFPQFKDELIGLYGILKSLSEGLDTGGIIGGLQAIGDMLLGFLPPGVLAQLGEFALGFEGIGQAIADRGPLIAEQLSKIGEAFSTAFSFVGPQLAENVTNALAAIKTIIDSEFVTGLIGTMGTIGQVLAGAAAGIITIVSGLISGGLQALSGDFSGAWETIKSSFAAGLQAIPEVFDTNWAEIGASWQGNLDNLGAIATGVFDQIKTTIGSKISEMAIALTDGVQEMIADAKGAAGDASAIGGALIDGITGAVEAGAGALAAALEAAVMGAIAAAKAAAGIQSPSKVTAMSIGAPMAQGVTGGINKEANTSMVAMTSLIGDAIGAGVTALNTATAKEGMTFASSVSSDSMAIGDMLPDTGMKVPTDSFASTHSPAVTIDAPIYIDGHEVGRMVYGGVASEARNHGQGFAVLGS